MTERSHPERNPLARLHPPLLRPPKGGKKREEYRNRTRTALITICSLVAFVAVWWALSIILEVEYLPPPDVVLEAFIQSFTQIDPITGRTMWDNIYASLRRVVLGFVVAFLLALPMGLVMGFSKLAEEAGRPIVEVFRPIPPLAWAPLLIVALGILWGPVIVVFVGVFFPLLSNTIFGVKNVDPSLLDAARTLGATRGVLFQKVILPATLPFLMTGVRIGLGVGWMCIVAAEFIAAAGGGVGYYILIQSNVGRYEYVFAGLAVIAILGLATTELSGYVEKRVSKWMGMKR